MRSLQAPKGPTLSSLPRDGYVGQSEPVQQLQDAHSARVRNTVLSPLGRDQAGQACRLIASFTL